MATGKGPDPTERKEQKVYIMVVFILWRVMISIGKHIADLLAINGMSMAVSMPLHDNLLIDSSIN